ncbi:protein arginine N-methyltransferase 7-like isoform X2 [Varroa jacobsoni]|uniref:protein arginine N-methyltransferase 7-like isoform X2 n=1 Tax=Varroa jacobsoni TaxID=62625 RepID=UPI000BF2C0F8|nr:protein arginine N-methyltransferase 7-like isoform X2 [Varroa jacobsoni]
MEACGKRQTCISVTNRGIKRIKWAISELRARGVQQIIVLDIGTGSSLLSMLAARHGADILYACDGYGPAITTARKVIEANGFDGRIKLISKLSMDLEVGPGKDLEQKANLLVAELYDTECIGEGLIESYSDAVKRLLTDDFISVPQAVTIFTQVVDSPFLRNHYVLSKHGLLIPSSIEECIGTSALHDIQASQLDNEDFDPITKPTATFHFDLSDCSKTPYTYSYELPTDCNTQKDWSPCVIMWWESQMAPDVMMSTAPRWVHPKGANLAWRDHWMQAVYQLPNISGRWLQCNRDEYSFWFNTTNDRSVSPKPFCTCGVHYSTSGYRNAYLADSSLYNVMCDSIKSAAERNILLVIEGGMAVSVSIAKAFPLKQFYVVDNQKVTRELTRNIIEMNGVKNCHIFDPENNSCSIELVVADVCFSFAMTPWASVQALDVILKSLNVQRVRRLPHTSYLMAMEMDFKHLYKIRSPIVKTVGLDLTEYSKFIEAAASQAKDPLETQPLWEYEGVARGLSIPLTKDIKSGAVLNFTRIAKSNGIALWMEHQYGEGNGSIISHGPTAPPSIGAPVLWNRYVKQGVILSIPDIAEISINI